MDDPELIELHERNVRIEQFRKVREKVIKTTPNEEGDIDWEEAGKALKEKEARDAVILMAKDLVNIQFPPVTWLVDGLIPSEGFTALTGTPASYKSFLTEHLAVCLTSNLPFLGQFAVTPINVMILDKENSLPLLQERFRKLGLKEEAELYLLQDPDSFKLREDDHLNWLVQFVKEKKIGLLIIDSFAHIHKGDENDSQAVVETFERLKKIPCAILFIHHHRKTIKFFTGTPLESIRGSSDIAAELESHIAVDQVTTGLRIAQYKNRRGELTKPFLVSPVITETSLTFSYGGDVNDEQTKSNKARELILDLFSSTPAWLKQDLITNFDGQIGQRTIEDVTKSLVKEGLLIEDWQGQRRLYRLSQELSQTANVPISYVEQSYLEDVQ